MKKKLLSLLLVSSMLLSLLPDAGDCDMLPPLAGSFCPTFFGPERPVPIADITITTMMTQNHHFL